jgi:hypothetical protein
MLVYVIAHMVWDARRAKSLAKMELRVPVKKVVMRVLYAFLWGKMGEE